MEINEIISNLKAQFGDKIDVAKVTDMLKGQDLSKLSMPEIIAKLQSGGLLGDLDGDGKVESPWEEIKGWFMRLFGKK